MEGFPQPGGSLLKPGSTYVLFLVPAAPLAGEDTTGQYDVVGAGAGAFLATGKSLSRVDEGSPNLPATIDSSALAEQVTS